MNLKDYARDLESISNYELKNAQQTWEKRADKAVDLIMDYYIEWLKRHINCAINSKYHRIEPCPQIHINYYKKSNYDKERPLFAGYQDGKTDMETYYEILTINTNNQTEALYCREKILKRFKAEGITIKKNYHYNGFFRTIKSYVIHSSFSW